MSEKSHDAVTTSSSLQATAEQGSMSSRGGPGSASAFEMAIDYVFSVSGKGTVVNGYVLNGGVKVGDALLLVKRDGQIVATACKGIEASNRVRETAAVGERVGILLDIAPRSANKGDSLVGERRASADAATGGSRSPLQPDSAVVRAWRTWLDRTGGSRPPLQPDSRYRGYGGWLALFGELQLFLLPISAVVMLVVGAAAISDATSRYPSSLVVYFLEALGRIAVVGLGMYAAIQLRRIRPGAVRATKRYLLAALAWSVLSFAPPPDSTIEAMTIRLFVRALIPFGIWFSYFNVSKRVKATYPEG